MTELIFQKTVYVSRCYFLPSEEQSEALSTQPGGGFAERYILSSHLHTYWIVVPATVPECLSLRIFLPFCTIYSIIERFTRCTLLAVSRLIGRSNSADCKR